ncbi:uncharacterized protein [Diabrotica undecimpunctata]|uniref:uncharacterized protein isoform X2 n=1 Tax=Diabrotica undecimpunctata TaxID=50387 RepID=UPI003B63727A
MAKKGQQVQLQAELNTDEEWEKFLAKDGLLVIDVYSDWCGPCSGMAANLKKIKLDQGGDLLQLAIAKSDNIEQLSRFRGRSEPTWLFVSKGKKINLLFGCNAPQLTRLILEELKNEEQAVSGEKSREYVSEITELDEIEIQRHEAAEAIVRAAREKEEAKREKEFHERKVAECNNILENLSHLGTILIFPSGRDRYHDALDDLLKEASVIATQTEKVKITQEIITDIFFFCEEKLSTKSVDDMLNGKVSLAMLVKRSGENLPGEIEDIVLQIVYGNSRAPPGDQNSPCQKLTIKKDNDEDEDNIISGIWAPPDKMTKALVLKHLFPNLTAPYKFPDAEPTPFYVAAAYDSFKSREVMELSDLYPGQVMMYGFFSSDKPAEAALISKTVTDFEERTTPTTYEEKIVIQLAKTNEECLLAFTELGPTYMSADAEKGEIDCKYFFPAGYNVPKEVIHEVKKKFKKKKAKAPVVNQEETTSIATSDIAKEQEDLEHEDEEANSDEERIECDVVQEENIEEETTEADQNSARSAKEADKATSPIYDNKNSE